MAIAEAAILGGASLVGGLLGSSGAKKASKEAARAQLQAASMQDRLGRETIGTQLALGAPQREASYSAVAALMDMIGLPRTAAGLGMSTPRELDAVTRGRILDQQFNRWADTWDKSRKYRHEPQHYERFLSELYGGRLPSVQAELDSALAAMSGTGGGGVAGGAGAVGSLPYSSLSAGHGITGVYELMDRPAYEWQKSPSYDWRFQQGYGAALAGLGSRGLGASGAELKALTEYGQGMASQEYDAIFNRLMQIAGFGGLAAEQSTAGFGMGSQLGASAAGNVANTGMLNAAGYIGSANSWANAINQIGMLPWDRIIGGNKIGYTNAYNNMTNKMFGD